MEHRLYKTPLHPRLKPLRWLLLTRRRVLRARKRWILNDIFVVAALLTLAYCYLDTKEFVILVLSVSLGAD